MNRLIEVPDDWHESSIKKITPHKNSVYLTFIRFNDRKDQWTIEGYWHGKRIYKRTGCAQDEKKKAQKIMKEFVENDFYNHFPEPHTGYNIDKKKFKYLIRIWENLRPNATTSAINAMKVIEKFLGEWTIYQVRTNLQPYIDVRHKGNKPNTIQFDMNLIRAVINIGADRGWCEKMKFSYSAPDSQRSRFLRHDERDKYIQCFKDKEHREFATVLVYQGVRFKQLKTLEGDRVFELKNEMKVFSRKGGQDVVRQFVIPMHPKAREVLLKRKQTFGNGYLFPDIKYHTFRRRHLSVCEELGITDYNTHDNRSTFATLFLYDSGANDREIAALLGHSGTKNVRKYAMNRDLYDLMQKLK